MDARAHLATCRELWGLREEQSRTVKNSQEQSEFIFRLWQRFFSDSAFGRARQPIVAVLLTKRGRLKTNEKSFVIPSQTPIITWRVLLEEAQKGFQYHKMR